MIESIKDICNKYNSTDRKEVERLYAVFYERMEHVEILKEHIIRHEEHVLKKLKKHEKDFPMNAIELLKEITPKDVSTARTYFESYILMLFSLTDILALMLFHILSLNADPKKLYFKDLIMQTRKIKLKQYNDGLIFFAAKKLYNSNDYKYFNALNNTIKHRSVISTSHTLKLAEVKNYFSIQEIEYNEQTYPKISSDTLFSKAELFIEGLKKCILALEEIPETNNQAQE